MWEQVSVLFGIILIIIVVNLLILGLISALIRRITNRALHLVIPALVMLAGYLPMMGATPENLIIGTYFFVIPMAVLIASRLMYGSAGPASGFSRICLVDFFLSILVVLLQGFVIASRYLDTPQYYQHMALSNGITYACVIAFDIVLAAILFRIMGRTRNRYPVRAGKEGFH
jgi:hypothetical protein